MASASYTAWVRAGRPFILATPLADLQRVLQGHGYTVYAYPDSSHQQASTPEDHTPYSATGWPVPSPRWYGVAIDIMPTHGMADLTSLARQVFNDKSAGVKGTEWIKYMNWTDEQGRVWHTKWQPNRVTTPSNDSGHIHISGRSDMVTLAGTGYDPVARRSGGGSGEDDDDMGATYINGQVPVTDDGPYNVNVGIVGAGAADPRPAWLNFCNDIKDGYTLRVWACRGDNAYFPLTFDNVELQSNGVVKFKQGVRGVVQLPQGTTSISILRQDSYKGSIGFSIERGAVAA
jgi:hypothetical protein